MTAVCWFVPVILNDLKKLGNTKILEIPKTLTSLKQQGKTTSQFLAATNKTNHTTK